MIYIFDIDGTIADISHRLHLIQGENKDWDSFYKACVDDKPIEPVINVLQCLAQHAEIWFFTGRSDIVKRETEEWIIDNTELVQFKLRMRKNGDYRPDHQIKESWLNTLAAPDTAAREMLQGVFEDRKSVCDMWRKNGIKCFQVDEGLF